VPIRDQRIGGEGEPGTKGDPLASRIPHSHGEFARPPLCRIPCKHRHLHTTSGRHFRRDCNQPRNVDLRLLRGWCGRLDPAASEQQREQGNANERDASSRSGAVARVVVSELVLGTLAAALNVRPVVARGRIVFIDDVLKDVDEPALAVDEGVGDRTELCALGRELTQSAGSVVDRVDGGDFGVPGDVLRLSAHVLPGNSGGPLLDGSGRTVGIVYAVEIATGFGLAIPIDTMRRLVDAGGFEDVPPCGSE
jgi:hypothetical protein